MSLVCNVNAIASHHHRPTVYQHSSKWKSIMCQMSSTNYTDLCTKLCWPILHQMFLSQLKQQWRQQDVSSVPAAASHLWFVGKMVVPRSRIPYFTSQLMIVCCFVCVQMRSCSVLQWKRQIQQQQRGQQSSYRLVKQTVFVTSKTRIFYNIRRKADTSCVNWFLANGAQNRYSAITIKLFWLTFYALKLA